VDPPADRWEGFEAYLLDQVQAAVIAADVSGRISHWNRHAEELLGWTPAEALGRDLIEVLIDSSQRETMKAILAGAIAGTPWEGELRIARKGGGTVLSYTSLSPIRDAARGTAGVVSVSVDVTERARQERLLAARTGVTVVLAEATDLAAAAPRIIRAVCENLGWELGALWRVDDEADVLRCVHVWHRATGEARSFEGLSLKTEFARGVGLPGRVWQSGDPAWIPDVTRDDNFPRAPVAADEGLHGAFGFPIRLGPMVLGVLEFFSRDIREPDELLLSTMTVIGSQIGQFIERIEAESALRQIEARTRAILEAALDCVITMDAQGRILEFNPAAERAFGRRREDVLGQPMAELIIPPSLRPRHEQGLARYLATGEEAILGRRVQLAGLRADGTEFPLELTITRVDVPGPPVFTGFLRDVTERRRQEDRERFLAQAQTVLSASLDYETTLKQIARLAVAPLGGSPLADWCSVHIQDEGGRVTVLALEHVDPSKVELALELGRKYPQDPRAPQGVPEVIRTGRSEIYHEISEDMIVAAARDAEHLAIIRGLALRSAMIVPLAVGGRRLGALTFAAAGSGRRYDADDLALAEDLAQRAALAVENARLYEAERGMAQKLQEGFLPPELPDIPGVDVAARYRWGGQGEVGGDFFDAFSTGPDSWAVVIGDVCGKGPEAALVTALARYTIRAVAMHMTKPSRVMAALNDAVRQQRSDRTFCTVCYARLRPSERGARLTVCCAGHPPPVLLRADGTVQEAGTPGALLGIFADPDLSDRAVDLGPGDTLVLFTDGVIEERVPGAIFGRERLESIVRSSAGMDAAAMAQAIEQAVLSFRPDPPRDDMAVLVLRVRP
jgi:PAS domain S-box-containing protein